MVIACHARDYLQQEFSAMTTALTQHIVTALAQFSSTTRLYAMTVGDGSIDLGPSGLLVEAFTADDAVNDIGVRKVIVLSTSAHIRLESLLGQPARMDGAHQELVSETQ
jgi:type VI secretion system secreted protein VgrG